MIAAYGVNLCPPIAQKAYDVYCPKLPGTPGVANLHSDSCKEKKKLEICSGNCQPFGQHKNKPTGKKLVLTQEQKDQIVDLYESGLSIRQVAEKVSRGQKTVADVLHEAGIDVSQKSAGKRVNKEVVCPRCNTPFMAGFRAVDVRRHEESGNKLPWRLCPSCNSARKKKANNQEDAA